MTFKKELNTKLWISTIFILTVIAWGTSWIMMKFQIANIKPTFAVSYRFICCSALLFLIAIFKGYSLKFNKKQHKLIFVQAMSLFFLNHIFFYLALDYVQTGIIATSCAMSVITIPIIDRLLHNSQPQKQALFGGLIGIIGVMLISCSNCYNIIHNEKILLGLALCFCGVISFSTGSVVAKDLKLSQMKNLIPSTAFAMLYGGIGSFVMGIILFKEPSFDFSTPYLLSLAYLVLFPGVFGFCGMLYLMEKIGANKASYIALLYPTIALILSWMFEGYIFTNLSLFGIILVILGNYFGLKIKKNKSVENVL